MVTSIPIEPLTAQAFKDFGDVIEANEGDGFGINQGYTWRHHKLATVEMDNPEDDAIISIFSSKRRPLPMAINMMERHPLGSQAFMPLTDTPFLVVVAEAGPEPKLAGLRAFVSNGKQGVNYSSGVWHHPLLILALEQNFLVVDRTGKGNNLNEVFFAEAQCGQLNVTDLINKLAR
ncbi:ureidoglycolate lyase [Candidatus Njordibacter sp. Uisw_056]|jgi:ureidoglycolate lyase|uniref:ureidoglycolate lyase n=1 Tax=Candidatus Njordibacter sp. Uisw_056 TaxID=3230973 RepID=UPI003FD8F437|tara:strand:+ start:5312 stop:5839 length:528 start_codon:yes stop_codon:yes gene_type:complete